jgi:hypothetical protein
MATFRSKVVEIEARQFNDGAEGYDILNWINNAQYKRDPSLPFAKWRNSAMFIPTLEGEMRADKGDWIICGLRGEFYPCKPDVFSMKYEAVGSGPPQMKWDES